MIDSGTLAQRQDEERDQHQSWRKQPGLRLHDHLPGREAAGAPDRQRRQPRPGDRAARGVGCARRCDRPRRRRRRPQRRAARRRPRPRPHAARRGARAGDDRSAAGRHLPRVGGAPRPGAARPLLRQRQRAVLLRHRAPQAGDDVFRVHGQPAVRRSAASARHPQAADLARRARSVRARRAPRPGVAPARRAAGTAPGAVVAAGAAQGLAEGDRGRRSGARAGRLRHRGAGRQDRRHGDGQRRAHGALSRQGRRDGARRRADDARPCARARAARRDDPGGHREGGRRDPRRRLPRDHRRPRGAAADRLPERLPADEPLRVRDPSALAGVLQGRQAGRDAVARLAAGAHGLAREAAGVRAAVRLLAGRGHPLADRRRGRGLADLGRRHAQGDHGAQPRVHLPAAARRRRHGQAPRRADHGPRGVHEGRRRRRRDGGPARVAADHHRQQLQRLGSALGRPRRAASPRPDRSRPGEGARAVQGDGGRRHRRDRRGVRAPARSRRRGGHAGLARDRQAAGAEGIDPARDARRQGGALGACRHAHRGDGHDRHRDLGCRQEGARHHEGEAGLRHHRRRPSARPAARGSRQATGRAGDRVGRDPASGRRLDEEHRPAEGSGVRLPGRDDRAGARGTLRELHRRSRDRVGEGARDLPARPQARHEAGRDLGSPRCPDRRRHRPRPQARPRRARARGARRRRTPRERETRPPPRERAAAAPRRRQSA